MICPKCGFEQPDAPECAKCGVIFSKSKTHKKPPEGNSPQDTLPSISFRGCKAWIRKHKKLIIALIIVSVMISPCIYIKGPRSGKVVDAVTGEGINGADVKYCKYYYFPDIAGYTGGCIRLCSYTNTFGGGKYFIGPQIKISLPFIYRRPDYSIYITKAEYFEKFVDISEYMLPEKESERYWTTKEFPSVFKLFACGKEWSEGCYK